MNLAMNSIFCVYLEMHLYDSVHPHDCDQVHLGMPNVILNIKSAIVKTELSYDGHFLHLLRHL